MSEGVSSVEPRLYRLSKWFDPEAAAVVTILLGLFQVLLSVLLAYADDTLPKMFILPLIIGILIVAGGSFTMASERNPSRRVLQGCACSNVAGLLGTVLVFCLYCYSLSITRPNSCGTDSPANEYGQQSYKCAGQVLVAYCTGVLQLLLIYDIGAVVMHGLLSVSAIKALKTH